MNYEFIFGLIAVSLFQLLGGLISWGFLKRYPYYERYALLAEMFLMIIVISELMKEGFAITGFVVFSLLAGFGITYLINKLIPHTHDGRISNISRLVLIAMLIHEIPEGMAFGSSFVIDPTLGIAIAILIGLHNIPEGSIVALPFLLKNKTKTAFKALILTQAAFIAGGMITYIFLLQLNNMMQAHIMTFAAGMMLFIVIEEGVLLK